MTTTTTTIAWYAQNEVIDDDGLYVEGDAALEAERAELAAMGAPDTDALVFLSYEPEDRDEAIIEARATPAFAAWVRERNIALDDEYEDRR